MSKRKRSSISDYFDPLQKKRKISTYILANNNNNIKLLTFLKNHYEKKIKADKKILTQINKQISKADKILNNSADNVEDGPSICVYTDGACQNNGCSDAKGGIGVHFHADNFPIPDISESLPNNDITHTNNRAEMFAIIRALEELYKLVISNEQWLWKKIITIFTDSKLIVNTMNKGWKKKANRDLWVKIDRKIVDLQSKHILVKFNWVKGHNGNEGNEIADELANEGIYNE